jgi:ribosomal protein RSM22 (predicted rRNA methylase)
MPATYAAACAALEQVARAVPALAPVTLLDLGGGTGAASWAAAEVFPTIATATVLDQVPGVLELGRRLAAGHPILRTTRWQRWRVSDAFPSADLTTVSYVLGELPAPAAATLVEQAARQAQAVLIVEPGTPAGYGRVLAARELLLASGLTVVAPCPHDARCPLRPPDWCHFAARVNRSALHRRVKGATLGYEDEKFAYVCAVRSPRPDSLPARVLRQPGQRKGLVQLRLCTPAGVAADEIVSKRAGDRYRAARDLSWGDPWPLAQDPTPR